MAETETLTTDVALGATIDARGPDAIPAWLGERYRVTRVLGRGGMGAVYHAIDQALDIEVALKQVLVPGDSLARLRDEVRLAQRVTHPNVCRVYDLEELDGNWLVKMEYVDGTTLAHELRRGTLARSRAVAITRDVCAGLAAAHKQGVFHCDLKPHNIMIETATGRVVLMDFGIARTDRTERGSVSGTPEYMAPEQVRGGVVDARTDLYALGCVLYEMIAGKRVFSRETRKAVAQAHVEDAPPPLAAPERIRRVVARLLDKNPANRYASADEVAAALADPPRRIAWWFVAGALAAAATAIVVLASRWPKHWQASIKELPSYIENSEAPVLSPDAAQYAYQSDREETGRYRIYVAPIDGSSPPRAITSREISAINPRWQRDGRNIVFSELDSGRAMKIGLTDGSLETIADDVTWLDDCGDRLLLGYNGSPDCLRCGRLVVREGSAEREIARLPSGAKLFSPRCDRQGRRALYSISEAAAFGPHEQYDLWLVPLDGGAARRVTNDHTGSHGTFTPDGRAIVFGSMRTGQWHLWEMPVDGGVEPVQRTFGEGWEAQPDIAPDGSFLIYSVDVTTVQLYARSLDGSPVRQLTAKAQDLRHPQLTSDGRTIIAEAMTASTLQRTIVSVPSDGGEPVELFPGTAPILSNDEIVYCDGQRIEARPRAGGSPRIVTELAGRPEAIELGPEGLVHIAVAFTDGWQAWTAPVAGGPATRELPAPWAFVSHAPRSGWRAVMAWTGELRRIRFVPPGADLDAPSARELTGVRTLAWEPDGKSVLLYMRERTTMHRFFVETGEDRVVAQGGDVRDITVSPDGNTIYTSQVLAHVRRQMITNFGDRPPVD